ncbi:MAG: hypothetical protein JJE52_02140 [Acidimicrobiia bacterium]|nr:hypothetical protein [Acidimicrobiia bacterium]
MRRYVVALGVGAAISLAPIMLSDRAPALLASVSYRTERALPTWLGGQLKDRLPDPDIVVHVLVYTALALLVTFAVWSWRSFAVGQLLLLLGGGALEVSQVVLTSGRSASVVDASGNLVGQVIGVVAGLVAVGAWRVVARRDRSGPAAAG